jgi:hypothetical protein
MSSITLQQTKSMFLIFPPGCGGNHLANLLSMHPYFAPRYTHAEYYRNMQDKYKTFFGNRKEDTIAHFSDLQNLQSKVLKTFTSKILAQDKPYVFCSHSVEYYIADTTQLIKPFTDRAFCLFSYPTGMNELVYKRMMTGAWRHGESVPHFEHVKSNLMYRKDIFARKCNINPNNIFTLDTDIFYTIKGYDYLHDTIKTNLGIELPITCRGMHSRYLKHSYTAFMETVDTQ